MPLAHLEAQCKKQCRDLEVCAGKKKKNNRHWKTSYGTSQAKTCSQHSKKATKNNYTCVVQKGGGRARTSHTRVCTTAFRATTRMIKHVAMITIFVSSPPLTTDDEQNHFEAFPAQKVDKMSFSDWLFSVNMNMIIQYDIPTKILFFLDLKTTNQRKTFD